MESAKEHDFIILGGSYAGLAAALSLGRALRTVLIIDSGQRCNRRTPHAHNLLTHDGESPAVIAAAAKEQVLKYDTVSFLEETAVSGKKTKTGFSIEVSDGRFFNARKIIIATGLKDLMPEIPGFAESWGISVLHCPYCHGYEVHGKKTGIIGNGEAGYEYAKMISNWTNDLVLFTNGKSTLTEVQVQSLEKHNITIEEGPISELVNTEGYVNKIVLNNGNTYPVSAIYCHPPFEQHSSIPEELGCEMTEFGHIKTDDFSKTTVPGVYAGGDNSNRVRSLSTAIASGSFAGAFANRELIAETF